MVPVYSPALVAFVGGGGFHVGVGVGVGWFPLAPGEVFVPWYRTSPRYVQNVNVTNTHVTVVQVTNVYNNVTVNHVNNVTYINQRVNNSVTVVNRETFVNARPVATNVVHVDQRQIVAAPVTHEVVRTIQPSQQSVIGATHPVRVAPPPQVMSRAVVATREPTTYNRSAGVPGATRTFTPPPVRTVRAVPPSEAQVLERGAHGAVAATPSGNAGRPANPDSGRTPSGYGANSRPSGDANPSMARPTPPVPRPSRQQTMPMTPERGQPVQQPSNPRPGLPENSRPAHEVPRPPQPQGQEGRPMPSYSRPENSRPESPRTMPVQPAHPDSQPQPLPNENRHQSSPMPQRTEPAPRPEPRIESAPRSEPRTESQPRPEARPAPQHESRPEEPRGSNNERGKEPPKFH